MPAPRHAQLAQPVFPPALAPGDLVVVVAPSSPIPGDELWRGVAWLRARYRVRISPGVVSRDGYLAGDDRRRRAELERALVDREAKAIVAARGGYGALRVIGDLPWSELARRPKWIVGFSDVTALHAMAWRAGVASVHGPNAGALGVGAPAPLRAAWLASVERPRAPRVWGGLRVVHRGDAAGPLVGGNLTLLHAMAAAGLLELPAGAVLAIEDVSEAPYRVDRALTSLVLGGHLARVAAIVVGSFDRCDARADGTRVDDVVADCTRALGVPVVAGAPFGHASTNEAFVLGAPAAVRGDRVYIHP